MIIKNRVEIIHHFIRQFWLELCSLNCVVNSLTEIAINRPFRYLCQFIIVSNRVHSTTQLKEGKGKLLSSTTNSQAYKELCHGIDTIPLTELQQERIDDLETRVMMLTWSTRHLLDYIQWLHINSCIPAAYKAEADRVFDCGETALAWTREGQAAA